MGSLELHKSQFPYMKGEAGMGSAGSRPTLLEAGGRRSIRGIHGTLQCPLQASDLDAAVSFFSHGLLTLEASPSQCQTLSTRIRHCPSIAQGHPCLLSFASIPS